MNDRCRHELQSYLIKKRSLPASLFYCILLCSFLFMLLRLP